MLTSAEDPVRQQRGSILAAFLIRQGALSVAGLVLVGVVALGPAWPPAPTGQGELLVGQHGGRLAASPLDPPPLDSEAQPKDEDGGVGGD